MDFSDIPGSKFNIPWGASAGGSFIRPIPQASQIGIQNGAASLADGFPPLTFSPIASGGVPPFGQDFNGIFNLITLWNQWQQAGGPVSYDSGFATAVGGYPQGTILIATTLDRFWLNLVDDNTNNPDTGGANWALLTRIRLTANTTFFVTTGGNDSTGTGAVGAPWLTLQHAINVIQSFYDLNNFQVTVSVGAGTFAGASISFCVGQISPLIINGAGVTTIFSSNIGCNGSSSYVLLQNMKFVCPNDNAVVSGGVLTLGVGLEFGACGGGHAHIYANSGVIFIGGSYTISGGADVHFQAFNVGKIVCNPNLTATLTGTPAFAQSFVNINIESLLNLASPAISFSGSATGVRYALANLSGIFGTAANVNFFPGNSAGSNNGGGAVYN